MTEKEIQAKKEEFKEKVTAFFDELDKGGFLEEELGCRTIVVASCDEELLTMCTGDGPTLAAMVAGFMAQDKRHAHLLEVAKELFDDDAVHLERVSREPEIEEKNAVTIPFVINRGGKFS